MPLSSAVLQARKRELGAPPRPAPLPTVHDRPSDRKITLGRLASLGKTASTITALALVLGLLVAAGPMFPAPSASAATTTVALGDAASYSVLAATTSTNAGTAVGSSPTHLSGDLGVSPGTSLTGFARVDSGPGIVDGTIDIGPNTQRAVTAQKDATAAYTDAANRASTVLSASTFDLGGHTYTPGVYSAGSSLGLTGTVTLDGGGNPDAVFIFRAVSTLITADGSPATPESTVLLKNGAQAANVFWVVGTSATLGTWSHFTGTILAYTSITATTGASIDGRLIALNGAVRV